MPVPSEALIGAGCALTTAIHASERAPLEWGDSVVVQGTGPVGSLQSWWPARQARAEL